MCTYINLIISNFMCIISLYSAILSFILYRFFPSVCEICIVDFCISSSEHSSVYLPCGENGSCLLGDAWLDRPEAPHGWGDAGAAAPHGWGDTEVGAGAPQGSAAAIAPGT